MDNHKRNRPPADDPVVIRAEQHEAESILQTIVRAVAAKKDVPSTELSPLYDQVDPDALGALLERARDQNSRVTVEFEFEGHRVVVSQGGRVRIHGD